MGLEVAADGDGDEVEATGADCCDRGLSGDGGS